MRVFGPIRFILMPLCATTKIGFIVFSIGWHERFALVVTHLKLPRPGRLCLNKTSKGVAHEPKRPDARYFLQIEIGRIGLLKSRHYNGVGRGKDTPPHQRQEQQSRSKFQMRKVSSLAAQLSEQRVIRDNLAGGIVARRAGDAAAGMCARATHIESLQRPPIRAMPQHRPRRPKLVE
jgi:hypothetical protein